MRTDPTLLIGMFIQSVRRLTLKPLVFLAVLSTAVILACKDDPLSPDGTGRLTITVVPYEGAQAEASAASDAESSAEARRSTATNRGTARPPEQTSDETRDLNIGPEKEEAKAARQTAAAPPRRDLLRVTVRGPETRTLDFIPNADGSVDVTIESLPEGLYSVELLGIDIDLGVELVSEYGINNSVTVVEDQTRTAVISFGSFLPVIDPTLPAQTSEFSFVVSYTAVPTATGYFFELDTDTSFSAPDTLSLTGTSVIINVDAVRPAWLRVRAENNAVSAAQAKPSDPVLVDVVIDVNPTGDDNTTAPLLGVGRGANGQYGNFNIYPATDEDWFAIDLTTDATLTVDVLTESLSSPASGGAALEVISAALGTSPLDPVVDIYDPSLTVIATNDDRDGTTVESRVSDVPIPVDGTYFIRVTSFTQSSVGHYELVINVNAEPVATVSVDPPTATISPSGTVQLTGRTFDIGGGELFGREAIWTTTDANVATVAPDGLVTGVADGTATITFSSETISASATITVSSVAVAKVVITPNSGTIRGIGQSVNLTAEARDATDTPIVGRVFNWYTSNTDVADATDGRVEGFGNGQTVVIAETGGVEGYALVTVTDPSSVPANYWSDGPASGVTDILFDIWGTSSNAMYAVGASGTILYDDGTGWTPQNSGVPTEDLLRVWGLDEYTVWAVGTNGTIVSTGDMGANWTLTTPTTEFLSGIWGAAPNDIFAVGGFGGMGVVLHYDGMSWSSMMIPITTPLLSVWGSASDDVFAVGSGGVILHYDGTSWTPMTSPTGEFLRTVWGTSNDDVFAVGINGTIVHYNGTGWTDMTDAAVTTAFLRSVWGTSSSEVIAVGDGGTIIQYDGVSWTADVSGTAENLSGVFGLPNPGILAVGTNGTVRLGNRGATLDLTASPTTIRNDAVSASTITAQAKDATGADITTGGASVMLSSDAGTLGIVTDNNNGTYTATLTSSLIVETATITGTLNGQAVADDATVRFTTADAAQSTITGSPTSIPADGASTSTITVQVADALGTPLTVGGEIVTLSTDLGTIGLVTDVGNGTYTATLTAGTTTGFATISGTLNGQSLSDAIVTFRGTSPPDLIGSTSGGGGANPSALYSIDRTTGAATPIGMIGFNRVGAMDVHPTTGVLYAAAQRASDGTAVLITIDQTTGIGTEIGTTGIDGAISDLSFHSDGTLYGHFAITGSHSLYTFNTGTGLATLIGLTGISGQGSGMAFNGTNSLFLASSSNLYALSTATGTGPNLGLLTYSNPSCSRVKAIDRDPATGVFYAALECGATDELGTLEITAGTVTSIGSAVGELDGIVDPATTPAPTTGPASALTSTITAPAGPIDADGVATAVVTVKLLDATSTALTVGGDHVTLSTTLGSVSAVTDNGDGTYTATLTSSTTAGTATITGTLNGQAMSDDAMVTFSSATAFQSVNAGLFHSCGMTSAGTAQCWGRNNLGQLGDGTNTNRNLPVAVSGGLTFQSVTAGRDQSCGVTTAAVTYCWGLNADGQLGNGTTTNSNVPVAVSGGLTFQSVSPGLGIGHSCGLTTAGAAYCWGVNSDGRLGDGTNTNSLVPVAVSGGLTFQSVSVGQRYSCGLTTAGAAYCWGFNSGGPLGDGTFTARNVPVAVLGGLSFQSLTAGTSHSCGVTLLGNGYCWGFNGNGELGDGTTTTRLMPVAISGTLTFQSVIAGASQSCGVTTVGDGYCWGFNGNGQLGNGTTTNSLVPVAVSGGLTFQLVGAHENHSCGLTTAGAGYCWGVNSYGQLGDGTTTGRLVPVRVGG